MHGDHAEGAACNGAVISGQRVLLDGNLVDIRNTASVRKYDINAAVPRFSVGGVPLDPLLLEMAWNALLDPF